MSEGSVFVRWYGSVVEGSVVENTTKDGPLAGMVAVRIPLMGMHPVALFCPQHVYETAAQASGGLSQQPVKQHVPVPPVVEPGATADKPVSEAWSQLQQFKREHWDEQRNHLQTDALDEFYQMWREDVRQRRAVRSDDVMVHVTEVAVFPNTEKFTPAQAAISPLTGMENVFHDEWVRRERRAAATRTNDRARQEAQTDTRRNVAPQPQRREKPVIKQLSLFDL